MQAILLLYWEMWFHAQMLSRCKMVLAFVSLKCFFFKSSECYSLTRMWAHLLLRTDYTYDLYYVPFLHQCKFTIHRPVKYLHFRDTTVIFVTSKLKPEELSTWATISALEGCRKESRPSNAPKLSLSCLWFRVINLTHKCDYSLFRFRCFQMSLGSISLMETTTF